MNLQGLTTFELLNSDVSESIKVVVEDDKFYASEDSIKGHFISSKIDEDVTLHEVYFEDLIHTIGVLEYKGEFSASISGIPDLVTYSEFHFVEAATKLALLTF